MNLSEFLENFYPETKIEVISKSDSIFQGYVKDFPKEEASLYQIGSKQVTFIEDIIRIIVVHEKDCKDIQVLHCGIDEKEFLKAAGVFMEDFKKEIESEKEEYARYNGISVLEDRIKIKNVQ